MVKMTNVVVQTDLHKSIDLSYLAKNARGIRYDPGKFSGAIWHHRKIGGCCLIFRNGKLNCNGSKNIAKAKRRITQYAQCIQRLGFPVKIKKIDVVTISAVHQVSSSLDFSKLCSILGATYEPEIFNGAMFKRGRTHFTCFHTGKIIITGVKEIDAIYPTLLEIELCTSCSQTETVPSLK